MLAVSLMSLPDAGGTHGDLNQYKHGVTEALHGRRPELHLHRLCECTESTEEGERGAQQLIFIGFKAINLDGLSS